MDCVRGFAGQAKKPTSHQHSSMPCQSEASFSSAKATSSSTSAFAARNSRSRAGQRRRMKQREHQSGGLADLARILKRLVGVCQRGLGIAKQPQSQRSATQDCHPDVLAQIASPADDAAAGS